MTSTAHKISTPASPPPIPLRFKWLKRFLKLGGLVLVGLLLLRWWWGWEAHRQLQAEIDRIVARGEPIFPEDFDPPEEIPDDQNAALAFIKAAEALTVTAEQDDLIENADSLEELTPQELQLLADLEAKNAETLRLVRQTRNMPGADWGTRFRDAAINVDLMMPSLAPQRQLCRVLGAIAIYQHHTGNDEQAIEMFRDVLHGAEVMDQMPTLISHLVVLAIDALGVSQIERVTHDLAIGDSPAASRDAIESLIAELLDELPLSEGLRTAIQVERMWQLDVVLGIAENKLGFISNVSPGGTGQTSLTEQVLIFPIKPLFEMDGVVMIRHMNQIIQACEQPNWPAADRIIKPLEQEWEASPGALGKIKHPVSNWMLPSLGRTVAFHHDDLARRRMAAIALAIRLYEIDHGRRPVELAELVPDYLDEVPRDPMAPDGATIRYRPQAEVPVLYSVGRNGIDDGGLVWDEKGKKYDRHNRRDLVFLLDGVLPDRRVAD
ncbi:MAG: hypothetical protein IIA66_14080 [Planctomycetes bacterium]|nr:hypothetical protein [Planctomycetota bacterium]